MTDESNKTKGPSRWRRIFWIFSAGLLLTIFGKAVIPEIASVGQDRIALVRIEGPILDAYTTVEELKAFGEDPLVKAIVLRIDSPGGGVAPSQEIYNAVKRIRTQHHKAVA